MSPGLGLFLRSSARSPASAVATIAVLWVGITVTSSLFGVVDALLLRPLPFHDPERLVAIRQAGDPPYVTSRLPLSQSSYEALSSRRDVFSSVGAFAQGDLDPADARTQEAGLFSVQVTPTMMEVLRARPVLGRPLRNEDQDLTEPRSVLIGHEVWRAKFAGDRSAVGRTTTLSGKRYVVVGVMPKGFDFPLGANVWTTIPRWEGQPERGFLHAVARLRPGVSIAQAQAAIRDVGNHPRQARTAVKLALTRLREDLRPRGTSTVVFLFGASALVLLVGTAQVAGLQVARAADRTRDTAIRISLGATHSQLFWKGAFEALMLAGVSLGAAWLVIPVCVAGVVHLLPAALTTGQHVAADLRTLAFSGIVLVLGAVLLGAHAARQVAVLPAWDALHNTRRTIRVMGTVRTRAGLVVVQCAATACLLYLGGTALRGFMNVLTKDLGFNTRHIHFIRLPFQQAVARDNASRHLLARQILETLKTLPNVTSVAGVSTPPLSKEAFFVQLGEPSRPLGGGPVLQYWITRDYFKTIDATIIEGRDFSEADERSGGSVAIVNETLARNLRASGWPSTGFVCAIACNVQVVGMVADICDQSPEVPPRPQVYRLSAQGIAVSTFAVRTAPDATVSRFDVERRLARLGVNGPTVSSMEETFGGVLAPARARLVLFGVLAGSAVILSAIGMLGAMTYVLRARTREIGIRLALGTTPADGGWRLLGMALRLSAVGSAVGLAAGAQASRLLASLVPNVRAFDAPVALWVLVFSLGVAAFASLLPIRRLRLVSPAAAIACE